jgi:hypothetical protein
MTQPHTSAAKTEKYRESGGIGFTPPVERRSLGVARGMNDAITREQMYSTTFFVCACVWGRYVRLSLSLLQVKEKKEKARTCSLIGFLSPKTK